jgi:glycosyltransferase involved in cell wall biosynthesis
MASDRVTDCLAKGLSELGHQVFYELYGGSSEPLPDGIELVREHRYDVDVMYLQSWRSMDTCGVPWVMTYHAPRRVHDRVLPQIRDNWIFVSKTHARAFARTRYVTNGIDPAEFTFSETKDDYFLFAVANLGDLEEKGFEIARTLILQLGIKVIVAGAPPSGESLDRYLSLFKKLGITYAGYVSCEQKAELFAGAKCLLFPTQQNESFGLVVAEALMSGTPVICSNNGACHEIVTPEVGFVCATADEYQSAVENIESISALNCRIVALERYHYLRMAQDYITEFEKEIALCSSEEGRAASQNCSRCVQVEKDGFVFTVWLP